MKIGDLVRFSSERDSGPVHRVVSVMRDGMLELHDMGGYFAPHLFVAATDVMAKHPIQPLIADDNGVIRFKANAIVRYLLDYGGIDLNQIAIKDFSREDREQFAQLIGYSHSGAGDLSYMSPEVIDVAETMHKAGKSEVESRNDYIQAKLDEVRRAMRPAIAELFDVGEDFDEV